MRKLNNIIEKTVSVTLLEQADARVKLAQALKGKTNPYVGPFNKNTSTLPAGGPWFGKIKKPHSATIQSFFNSIGAKPYKDSSQPSAKQDTPTYVFQFAKETFWFYADGKVFVVDDGRTMYWKYFSTPYGLINNAPNLATTSPTTGDGIQLSKSGTGQIRLYNNSNLKNAEVIIYISQNGQPNIAYTKSERQLSAEESARKRKQNIRNWLDVAGFVPYVGDAVDVYQALWYWSDWYYEGRKTEDLLLGCLSAIAVIPFVGSFIASSSRKIVRNVIAKYGKKASFANVVDELIGKEIKNLSNEQKKQISKFLISFASNWNNYSIPISKTLKKYGMDIQPVLDAVSRQFDQAAARAKKISDEVVGATDDIADINAMSAEAKKLATNLGNDVAEPGYLKGYLARLSSLSYDKSATVTAAHILKSASMRKLSNIKSFIFNSLKAGVTSRKAKYIQKAINDSFVYSLKYDPERVAAMVLTATGKMKDELIQLIVQNAKPLMKARYDVLWKEFMVQYAKKVKSGGFAIMNIHEWSEFKNLLKYSNIPSDVEFKTIDEFATWYYMMQKRGNSNFKIINDFTPNTYDELMYMIRKIPASTWDGVCERFAKICMDGGHAIWNYIVSSPENAFRELFPDTGKGVLTLLNAALLDGKKWLDIVYGIGHDAIHDSGISLADDDKQSLVYQAIKDSWRGKWGYGATRDVVKGMVDFFKKPITAGAKIIGISSDSDKPLSVKGSPRDSLWTPPINANNKQITPKPKKSVTPTPTKKSKFDTGIDKYF